MRRPGATLNHGRALMMNDFKFAFRQLAKNPGFTAVAVITLALGVGANTAIFSFVNAILLRPLPYKEPERLVMVYENEVENGWHKNAFGAPVLGEWRRQNTVFEGLAGEKEDSFVFTGRGQPENLRAATLSANAFSLLRIKPLLGRDFISEEETYGKHHVALLSYEFWQSRFGGDPQIIGQNLMLDSEPYTVVGVMPPRIQFPNPSVQVWTPLAFSPDRLSQRHAHSYFAFGRLKSGITLVQARADMDLIAQRMAAANTENKGWGAEVFPLQETVVGDSRRLLYTLLGAVGLVLLIGCANIANLLLARGAARAREFAIRSALGAGRWQIIRQLLAESLLLAALGAAAGTALAALGLDALIRFSPPDLPRVAEGIPIDALTLAFTASVALVTGIAFGLFPAIQWSKPSLAQAMNAGARGNSSSQRQRTRSALVVGEVALSLMLLVAGGLMIRSFGRLVSQQLGFKPEHLVTVGLDLPDKKYPEQEDRTRLFEQFLDRVKSVPGIDSAALVLGLPLTLYNSLSVEIPGAPPHAQGEGIAAAYSQISANYFKTMEIAMLQGRDFTEQDRAATPPLVIVNEAFVKEFRLGTNVIGRQIGIGDSLGKSEIIGVVAPVKRLDMAQPAKSEMFRMYKQICWGSMSLAVRTQRDPEDALRAVRLELDALDKDLPLTHPVTMTKLIASSVAQRRLSVQLFAAFAGIALLLAAIGLYGLLAYLVAQRRQEIGIRMALGAQRADVLGMVLRQGMVLAGLGIAIGLAGAFSLAGVMRHLLFGIGATDPATFALITLLLAAVALAACWLPARRATRVDPMVALRSE